MKTRSVQLMHTLQSNGNFSKQNRLKCLTKPETVNIDTDEPGVYLSYFDHPVSKHFNVL